MKSRKFFISFALVLVLFISFSTLSLSDPIQQTFTLDLDKFLFNFTEKSFNDSSSFKLHTYESAGDLTLWVRIPKNSEVLESNITFEGLLKSLSSKGTGKTINDIYVGNINESNEYDEIVLGTEGTKNIALLNHFGDILWEKQISYNSILSVFAGNLSSDEGLEIVAGDDKGNTIILTSNGTILYSKSFGSAINDIYVGNINESNEYDEIVLASGSRVYILNNSLSEIQSLTSPYEGFTVKSIGLGNLSSDEGLEIVAGATNENEMNSKLIFWNSTGEILCSFNLSNINIYSIGVSDLNASSPFDEIVIGGYNSSSNKGIVLIANKDGNVLWRKETEGAVRKIAVEDVTDDFSGKEIIAGSEDTFIYIFSSSGTLIGKFQTENKIYGVNVGNLTSDPGLEIVAGTVYQEGQNNNLFILNYQYFPTNLTLDIGNDGIVDFYYQGKLRTENWTSNNTAFNTFLKKCSEDLCDVPIVFHSDFPGILNVTSVYLFYSYNTSQFFTIDPDFPEYSRRYNIWVNESVGYPIAQIRVNKTSEIPVRVDYIKTNATSRCDFDGEPREIKYVNGIKVCDISSSSFNVSGGGKETHYFWDDSMPSRKVVFMNESAPIFIPSQSLWSKNLTIWSEESNEDFYNVTANYTINTSLVKQNITLEVFWNNTWRVLINDSTPASPDCFNSPQFSKGAIEDDSFYVCKEVHSNENKTIFVWKQPKIAPLGTTFYRISGFTNKLPEVKNVTITPNSTYWGDWINVSFNCFDEEDDGINVKTFLKFPNSTIILLNETNCTSGDFLSFNLATEKNWIGTNYLFFELRDYDSTSSEWLHLPYNTSITTFEITKRDVNISYVSGNNTKINRTDYAIFEVLVNDSVTNESIENVSCGLWIISENSSFLAATSFSNSSGYCSFHFQPNQTVSPGRRTWLIGVLNDSYYKDRNSSIFYFDVYGHIKLKPVGELRVIRNEQNYLYFKLEDEFNQTIFLEGLNVSLKVNSQTINSSLTNSSGIAEISFTPDCTYSLGHNSFLAYLENTSEYYLAYENSTSGNLTIYDYAYLIFDSIPSSSFNYHTISITTHVEDSCGTTIDGKVKSWKYEEKPYYNDSLVLAGFIVSNENLVPPGENELYKVISVNETSYLDMDVKFKVPGSITLTGATKESEYYLSSSNSTSLEILGKMRVNLTEPSANEYERQESSGRVEIKCWVNDSFTKAGVIGIPVNIKVFWINGSQTLRDITLSTDNYGMVSYPWDISSNSTSPEGLYNVSCSISDNPPYYYAETGNNTKWKVVKIYEKDIKPPQLEIVELNHVPVNSSSVVKIKAYDFYGVYKAWMNLTKPDGSSVVYFLQNESADLKSSTWSFQLSSTDLNEVGDYDVVFYANDTSNNTGLVSGWFYVYKNKVNATVNYSSNIVYSIELYRPGRNLLKNYSMYKFYSNDVNGVEEIIGRTYDLKAEIPSLISNDIHKIIFYSANLTKSINESLVKVSEVPLSSVFMSVPTRHKIVAFDISSPLKAQLIQLVFNYSSRINSPDPSEQIDYESPESLRLYVCHNFTSECNSGWEVINATTIDKNLHVLTANLTSLSSVYYLAEIEICGNGICDFGESPLNCPQDCGKPYTGGGGGGIGTGVTEVIDFEISSNISEVEMTPGETKYFAVWIKSLTNKTINVSLELSGSASKFTSLERNWVEIENGSTELVSLKVSIPSNASEGTYLGEIIAKTKDIEKKLPFKILVKIEEPVSIDLVVEALTPEVRVNDTAKFHVSVYNLGPKRVLNLTLQYSIKNLGTDEIIYVENESIFMVSSYSLIKEIHIPSNWTSGMYSIVVDAILKNKIASSSDVFKVTAPLITQGMVWLIILFSMSVTSIVLFIWLRKRYLQWKKEKMRYLYPVDFRKLPEGNIWLGKIAETNRKAYFDMNDLTTHIIVAGATGAGKSVTASIFVEELLDRNIPVVVFDPTAQWTGFVRACRDKRVLRYYKSFGLDPKRHPRSYKGLIFDVPSPNVKINFKKLMNPGEITIFTLNKLKPGEYDDAVKNIIDSIFAEKWEESTELKLVIVFDEVHRLLERYGGKGGYVALERAAREFRKWGIGLIMVSQVLSDFKEAVKGNVLTEIQMHTKGLGDLRRVETKYGLEYAKRVAKLEVGVGMMQNPKYNDGKPWFVSFRPPYHNPHKLTDKELETYHKFGRMIEEIERKIEEMEKEGKDVFNLKIELKLAKDRLKQGRFRMAEIYLTGLKKKLGL